MLVTRKVQSSIWIALSKAKKGLRVNSKIVVSKCGKYIIELVGSKKKISNSNINQDWLRKKSLANRTEAEVWAKAELLKNFDRKDFRVEYAFQNRRFDFYFPKIKVAVEIDGEYHRSEFQRSKDQAYDIHHFTKHNIVVQRCFNFDEAGLKKIIDNISQRMFSQSPTCKELRLKRNKDDLMLAREQRRKSRRMR